jgi:IS1 family transposase
VGKKEKNCDPDDPADDERGDHWDHVAFDPEHRLVVSVIPGRRTTDHARLLVEDFHQRTGGRIMNLMTSDEHPAYSTAILEVYGVEQRPPRTGKPGRPPKPVKVPPPELKYATVHKTRKKGRVVKVEPRVVFGGVVAVLAALAVSLVSKVVNTFFLERHNGTDRNRNGRKARKTYCFSKAWSVHEAMTYFTMCSYNFCWCVRSLRIRGGEGHWQGRTPAMAAGLADHVWTLQEWLSFPAVNRQQHHSRGGGSWQ